MGDIPIQSQPAGNIPDPGNAAPVSALNQNHDSEERRDSFENTLPSASRGNYPSMQSFASQHQAPHGRREPFDMTSMGSSLPDISYQNYSSMPSQRYPGGTSVSQYAYQLQNVPQFASPPVINPSPTNIPYNMQYQSQYPGVYMTGQSQSPANLQAGLNTAHQYYQSQGFAGQHQQPGSQFFIQQGQYGTLGHMYPPISAAGTYSPRGAFAGDNRISPQQRSLENQGSASAGVSPGRSSSIVSSISKSSVVRGPPRKPRQSGHAIWIGNLPPQTDLMNLVFHVCQETPGLESLFLISKSNCAFANFKDETSCATAQMKIHDSRFQTVRLVSRLRRSSVGTSAGVPVPTGPAALTPPPNPTVARTPSPDSQTKPGEAAADSVKTQDTEATQESKLPKEKFFIVKSLTVEDLELSVRNGIWATQSHNEDALNKAYQTVDNVYLIFSANKSGEYFGYARMISPINDDPAAAIEFAPKAQTVDDPELPKAIPTPATENAPKGRIIDDSARGTIFWEAERDEVDGVEEEDETGSNRSDDSSPPSKAWGKPFKIEWISTTRLPFYRTRGLRNPWNSNREVKIARDGTELETSIGHRLLTLFHRLPSPVVPSMQGTALPLIGGYPPVAPFQ